MKMRTTFGGLALLLALVVWLVPADIAAAPAWRVGLQVGHWKASELPDELASLRGSTGAYAAGVQEYEVNLDVAQRAAGYLRGQGVAVDVLPATLPQSYLADAFVTIHADGNRSTQLSGFKIAGHWREWEASKALEHALRSWYGPASGLRWDGDHISSNMRGYYGLSAGRYRHAISTYTPGVILEMGYLTNPGDRRLMIEQADRLARAIADGILMFLRSEPENGWPAPPPLPDLRATVVADRANLRAGPGIEYPITRSVNKGRMLMIERIQGDWLKVYSYRRTNTSERWVRRDLVTLERISQQPPQDGEGSHE